MRYIVVTLLIALTFAVWAKLNTKRFHDPFSPFLLLFFGWTLPLMLRLYRMSGFEEDWPPRTTWTLVWVTAALALPTLFARRESRHADNAARFHQGMSCLREPLFLGMLMIAWGIVFAGYLYAEFITNPRGIPLLSAVFGGDDISRSAFHRWGKDNTRWTVLTSLLFVISPILYLAFRINRRRRFLGPVLLAMALLYPIFGFLKVSRSDIFIGGLNIGFAEFFYRRCVYGIRGGIPVRKLIIIGLIGMTLFTGLLIVRLPQWEGANVYARYIRFKIQEGGPWVEALAQIYGYCALPFENFHRYYDWSPGGWNPGISVLRPFLSIIMRGDIADAKLEKIEFNSMSTAAGSHTFLTYPYAELGMFGVLGVPLIYGVLMAWLYSRLRRRPTFVNVFLYVNFMFPWLFLYFGNGFSVFTFYINSLFVLGLAFLWFLIGPRRTAAAGVPAQIGLRRA